MTLIMSLIAAKYLCVPCQVNHAGRTVVGSGGLEG